LDLRKRLQSILLRSQAKMPARSPHLCTAESTVIVIAVAGGGTAVVTAAASATGANVQGRHGKTVCSRQTKTTVPGTWNRRSQHQHRPV